MEQAKLCYASTVWNPYLVSLLLNAWLPLGMPTFKTEALLINL